MRTKPKPKQVRMRKLIRSKKPNPRIGGRLIGKDDPKAKIDDFLYRQAMSSWKTFKGLAEREVGDESKDWLDSQVTYWRQVASTIEMLRSRNYPHGWR